MINRPKVRRKGQPEPHKPVSGPSRRATKIFGRVPVFETMRLAGPPSVIQKKPSPSTSLKYDPLMSSSYSPSNTTHQPPISPPHAVASILNDMYAHPIIPRARNDSHRTWERDQTSLHIDTHIGGLSVYSRDSVDLNPPQPNEANQSIYFSLRSHLSRESFMTAASRGGQSALSVSSGESSGSRGNNNSSSGSQESGSTLRVVGRGGSGSRLRQVGPQSQTINTVTVRQEHRPPLIRPSGRGGLGSRPKPLAAPPAPSKDAAIPKSPELQTPILIRPSGRGGLASRPKPPGSTASPTLLKLLSKSKIRVDKGKGKAPEERRVIHPIPPNQIYQVSNASSSTLSTIHFIGETGEPSTPFFPDDRSVDSNHSDAERSLSSPSSMFSSDQHSSRTTILSDQTEDNVSEHFDESRPTTPVDHRKRNISKLTRTLGDMPDDILFKDVTSQRPTDNNTPAKKERNAKLFRRSSISMTSLGSMFGRSGGRGRDSTTTSTMTDDLHQFGLADDLSESWGNLNESSSSVCQPPPSPIVFSPPSPLPDPNPKVNSELDACGLVIDEAEQLTESDTLSFASSTLSRSNSYSSTPSQRPSTVAHSRSTSTSILTNCRVENNKSIWLIPVKDDDLEIGHVRRVDIADRPQNWSGEWNNDLHQVIKSLRLL